MGMKVSAVANFLERQTFSTKDVERFTGGHCTSDVQRNWNVRKLWACPWMQEPRAGKGREFPGLAVIEAVILTRASQSALSLQAVSDALKSAYVSIAGDLEKTSPLIFRYRREAEAQRESYFNTIMGALNTVPVSCGGDFDHSYLLSNLDILLTGKRPKFKLVSTTRRSDEAAGPVFGVFEFEDDQQLPCLSVDAPNFAPSEVSTVFDLAAILERFDDYTLFK